MKAPPASGPPASQKAASQRPGVEPIPVPPQNAGSKYLHQQYTDILHENIYVRRDSTIDDRAVSRGVVEYEGTSTKGKTVIVS